ncbi:GNAT family protein [Bacillus sp. JCM 19041]|uniref:GNAT family N-acetyltransferase n=1 Tax=Bacillus sp. JCM 19041 TaxID=1460637 RepID=UPI0006D1C6B7
MEQLTIRSAQIGDAEAIIKHTKHVLAENPLYYGTAVDEFMITVEEEEEWIKSHTDKGVILLAELGGQLVGMVHLRLSTSRRFAHQAILGISIKEAFAGKGIGSKLIKQLLEWAKENPQIEKVSLEVFSNNERGMHLYKKLGFKEEGRRVRNARLDDGTYVDDIIMAQFV